jgi:hypothetical protein
LNKRKGIELCITEEQFYQQVVDLAHVLGWRVAHFRAAQTAHGWRTPVGADGEGFPDLVMVRAGRIIFVELKSQKGVPSFEQAQWLQELGGALWKPSDWELIERTLR